MIYFTKVVNFFYRQREWRKLNKTMFVFFLLKVVQIKEFKHGIFIWFEINQKYRITKNLKKPIG